MSISEIYALFKNSDGIATDTRKIAKNQLYFALKGANFNGNLFAQTALDNGASYAIVDEVTSSNDKRIIQVEDALSTLQELATFHRKELAIPIIALTGSNGKTTTKELIHAVLSKKYKTTATIGNLNNHIGVPLTLLSMDSYTEIGIVEMGANHQKEIELLSEIAEPNFGYITNFGKAHLEGFGGIEGVIKGKSELYQYLKKSNGTAIINTKDPIQIAKTKEFTTIHLNTDIALESAEPFVAIQFKNARIQTNLIGVYNLYNIVAAITIGLHFEIEKTDIKQALEAYTPTNNRSQIIEKKGVKIVMDAYNANPSSMKVALENFHQMTAPHKTLILGDMFELGITSIAEHQLIADLALQLNFNTIYLIGEHFSKVKAPKAVICNSFEAFKDNFIKFPSTYLIKGSRGMALEKILDFL